MCVCNGVYVYVCVYEMVYVYVYVCELNNISNCYDAKFHCSSTCMVEGIREKKPLCSQH